MARYDRHGGKIPTTIFEAAAWHKAIKPLCSRCPHSAIFHPHSLWWWFSRRGWNDDLRDATKRFWCRQCAAQIGRRVRPRMLDVVAETEDMICLPMPSQADWKKAVNRFRS